MEIERRLCDIGEPAVVTAALLEQEIAIVIDHERTGRVSIHELEKVEKTYIGTRVEIGLRSLLGLMRGRTLDNAFAGHDFDSKWSMYQRYMIPPEAVGKHCLIVGIDLRTQSFQLGVVRADLHLLSDSQNRDRKRTFTPTFDKRNGLDRAAAVAWIVRHAAINVR